MNTKLNINAIPDKSISSIKLSDDAITAEFIRLCSNTALKFFCIEPVTIQIGDHTYEYAANTNVELLLKNDETFTITPTTDNSISVLSGWPGALNEWFSWLEGVNTFSNIVFDMNDLTMYEK